jgi:hypothetical protein
MIDTLHLLMSVLGITTSDRITLAAFLIFLVVMHPSVVGGRQIGLDGGLVPGRMAPDFAAGADALVGLDMRAGGHLLQENFDGFRAFAAFKGKDTSGFQHDQRAMDKKSAILSSKKLVSGLTFGHSAGVRSDIRTFRRCQV